MAIQGRPGRHSKLSGKMVWDVDPSPLLERLKLGIRNKIVKKALGKGAAVLRKAVRQVSPVDKKVLRPSIGIKIPPRRNKPIMYAVIGARSKYQKQVGIRVRGKNAGKPIIRKPAKYLHLVDQGTVKIKPRMFMDQALRAKWPESREIMRDVLAEEIVRYFV